MGLRRALGIALLLAAAPAAAAPDPFVTGQMSDYQAIRQLQEKTSSNELLPEEGAPKSEMLLALADTGARGAGSAYSENLKAPDYDALYALLQKYRDELHALGLREKTLEDLLSELRRNQELVNQRLKVLSKFNFDGLKIYGDLSTFFDDEAFSGPGSKFTEDPANPGSPKVPSPPGTPFRYRAMKQSIALKFVGTRGPISALAVLQNDMYFGNESANKFNGLTHAETELRLPVVIQAGDIYAHMTPLTLWRNEDPIQDEPEPFASRRQRHRDDLYLRGNDMNMRGVRLHTDLVLFEKQAIHLQAMLHGVGFDRTILYYMGGNPPNTAPGSFPDPATANALTNGNYNTYLGAWQAQSSLMDLLELGYAGTMFKDSTDSGAATYTPGPLGGETVKGFDSQVHSLQVGLKFFDGKLQLGGEVAQSLFNTPNRLDFYSDTVNARGHIGYLTGTASVLRLQLKDSWYSLEGSYRYVDRTFVSAPAQGRSQDSSYAIYGPFMHENLRYNPVTNDYSAFYLWNHPSEPGFENFNSALLPPQMLTSPHALPASTFFFNYLLPYNAAINAGSPYGEATPNREGTALKESLSLMNGMFKPWARLEMLNELSGVRLQNLTRSSEAYQSFGGGLVVDLKPRVGWPVAFSLGLTQNRVSSKQWVDFNSSFYQSGILYDLDEKTRFSFGLQHIDYKGVLAYPLYGSYTDPISGLLVDGNLVVPATMAYRYQQSYDIWSLGLRYQLNEQVTINLDYGSQYFWDEISEAAGLATHYQMEQGSARLVMQF